MYISVKGNIFSYEYTLRRWSTLNIYSHHANVVPSDMYFSSARFLFYFLVRGGRWGWGTVMNYKSDDQTYKCTQLLEDLWSLHSNNRDKQEPKLGHVIVFKSATS